MLLKYLHMCTPKVLALCVDTYIRKSKPILAMKCLQTGITKYPNHPALLPLFIKFAKRFHAPTTKSTKSMSKHAVVKDLVRSQFQIESLLNNSSAEEYVNDLIANIDSKPNIPMDSTQLEFRFAVARCKLIMSNNSKEAQDFVVSEILN